MSIVEYLSQPFWQRLGLTLLHFLWQGLAVAVLVGVFVRVLRLKHGNTRYGAYLLAFIAMIACPVVTFTAIDIEISANTEPVTVTEQPEVVDSSPPPYTALPAVDILPEVETVRPAIPISADSIPLGQRISGWLNVSMPWVLVIWMAGVAVLSVRLLMGFVGVYRWRHHLEPLPERLVQRIASLSEGLGMRGFSRVFISPTVLQAMAVGYLRPMVLLPVAMLTQMQPEMLEAVIAHELAHIRRFDLWINLVQRITETLLFYHPAVWWLSNCLRRERELCCDELAVKATGERITYASTLESVGRAKVMAKQPVLAAGLGQDKKPTLGRVRHILGLKPAQRNCPFWLAGVITVLFLAALIIPTTLALTNRSDEKLNDLESVEVEGDWGEAVEGVQMRVRPERQRWYEGETPKFLVDMRNKGTVEWELGLTQENWEVELDGVWHRVGASFTGVFPTLLFGPGQEHKDIEFYPGVWSEWNINGRPLKLTPGLHTVRLSFGPSTRDRAYWRRLRVVSNPVVIEILPADADKRGWGEAVAGMQCGLRADKRLWKADETPKLKAIARNVGRGPWRLPRPSELFYLKAGSKIWRWKGTLSDRPADLKPGEVMDKTTILLSEDWVGAYGSDLRLKLSPGKHTVQLVMFVSDPAPPEAVPGTRPIPRQLRIESNVVAIEVLPKGERSGTVDDEDDAATTLQAELHELWRQRDQGLAGAEAFGKKLLEKYTKREEKPLIYYQLAEIYAQSGQADPNKIVEFARQGWWYLNDPVKKARLFAYWGDALQLTKGREEAARIYLRGLQFCLQYGLPKEKLELPTVSRYTADGPAEEVEKHDKENKRQMAARKHARLIGELIEHRQALTERIFRLYAPLPDAFDELHELAMRYLGSEHASEQIIAAAKSYRTDHKTAIPVIMRLGGDPNPRADLDWGEETKGIRVRLRADTRSWGAGSVPKFKLDVRNDDSHILLLTSAPDCWGVEVDGVWYRITIPMLGGAKGMSFGPDKRWYNLELSLDKALGSQNENGDFALAPGRHTVRAALASGLSEDGKMLSVGAVSDPVEIVILPSDSDVKDKPALEVKIQEKKDQKELSKFKTTLPNGVTVELVGICDHPSEGKQWWLPDGSLLGQSPVRNIDVGGYSIRRGEAAYELVAKLTGPETLLRRSSTPEKWKVPQAHKVGVGKYGTAKDKSGKPCLRATTAIVKNGLEKIDIEFGLAGVWEKRLTISSNESSKQEIRDTGVVINPPYEKNSNATITIKIPNKIDSQMAINITAVLKNGKVIGHASWNRNSKFSFMRSTDNYEFNRINLSDVGHFEIYTSKYQWVTFKNVSLKPNFKTAVQIEVEKSQEAQKVKEVYLPNIDKIHKMLDLGSGKLLAITGVNNDEGLFALLDKRGKSVVLYDGDKSKGHLAFFRCKISNHESSREQGFSVVPCGFDELPFEFNVETLDGSRYRIKTVKADNYQCQLEYYQLRHNPDVEIEVEKAASNNSGGDQKRHQHVTFKEEMSIREALRFLGNAHKKNIILSNKVAGQVPVNELYNVTFEEALQAILGTHKYIIDGKFIRVYTEEEFKSIYPEGKTNSQVEVEKTAVQVEGARLAGSKLMEDVHVIEGLMPAIKLALEGCLGKRPRLPRLLNKPGPGILKGTVKDTADTYYHMAKMFFVPVKNWPGKPAFYYLAVVNESFEITGIPPGSYYLFAIEAQNTESIDAVGLPIDWPRPVTIDADGKVAHVEIEMSTFLSKKARFWNVQGFLRGVGHLNSVNARTEELGPYGRVVDAEGKPIPYAKVQVREFKANRGSGGIASPDARTNEQGYYGLRPLDYPYFVGAIVHEPLINAAGYRWQYIQRNKVFEGKQAINFEFNPWPSVKRGGGIIEGTVVDANNNPIPSFIVDVRPAGPLPKVNETSEPWYESWGLRVAFAAGKFSLGDIPEGACNVRIMSHETSAERGVTIGQREVTVSAGQTTHLEFQIEDWENKRRQRQVVTPRRRVSKQESGVKTVVAVEAEETEKTDSLVWGKEVNGLRAAVEFVPEKGSYEQGEVVGIRFHLQNVSNQIINLSTPRWWIKSRCLAEDQLGIKMPARRIPEPWGMTTIDRHKLLPGQVIKLESGSLAIAKDETQGNRFYKYPVHNVVTLKPGQYSLYYRLSFPGITRLDGDGKVVVPQPDDWQGALETGKRKLVIISNAESDQKSTVLVEGTGITTEKESEFSAILPNGVTVELIGMCEYPSVDKQWWRPDGSLLVNPPYDESNLDILSSRKPNAIPIEFAFRLSGNLGEPAWEAKVKGDEQAFIWWTGRRAKDGEFLTDIKSIGMFVKSDQRILDLRLGFSLADRPYEWADFKNISVKPNFKPDVQVEVEEINNRSNVKGQVLGPDGKPTANQEVYLQVFIGGDVDDENNYRRYNCITDANGQYVFDNVEPGSAHIGRMFQLDDGATGIPFGLNHSFEIEIGKDLYITLGGKGRRVIGRLVPASGIEDAIDWSKAKVDLNLKAAPMAFGFMRENAKYMQALIKSERGNFYRKDPVKINPDGTFQLENIRSGQYMLRVYLPEHKVKGFNLFYNFTVDLMRNGTSDKPLNLGTLAVSHGDYKAPRHIDNLFLDRFELDKDIPVILKAGNDEEPDVVSTKSIRFEKDGESVTAALNIEWKSIVADRWQATLKFRSENGSTLARSDVFFKTSKLIERYAGRHSESLHFAPGHLSDLSKVKYFLLTIQPVREQLTASVQKERDARNAAEAIKQVEVEKTASNDSIGDSKSHQHITFIEGMSIREALRFLGKAFKKNIIPSEKVAGQVPVNELYNVTFEEALQAILGTHKYKIDGKFIRVYTEEEFESIYPEEKTNSQVEVEKPAVEVEGEGVKTEIQEVVKDFWKAVTTEDWQAVNEYSEMDILKQRAGALEHVLAGVGAERKGLLSRGINISRIDEVYVKGKEAIAVGPANGERYQWYYLQKRGDVWVIKLFDDAPPRMSVQDVFFKCRSVGKLMLMGERLTKYAADHQGKLPENLEALEPYIPDTSLRAWLRKHVEYLGKGKEMEKIPNSTVAYTKTLVSKDENTSVLFNDGIVDFVRSSQVERDI